MTRQREKEVLRLAREANGWFSTQEVKATKVELEHLARQGKIEASKAHGSTTYRAKR